MLFYRATNDFKLGDKDFIRFYGAQFYLLVFTMYMQPINIFILHSSFNIVGILFTYLFPVSWSLM